MLFNLGSVYSDVTIYFVLNMVWGGDSLPIPTRVFISMGEFLVVDQVYPSCDCPLGRVASLVRLVRFSYGRFGVVWDS